MLAIKFRLAVNFDQSTNEIAVTRLQYMNKLRSNQ